MYLSPSIGICLFSRTLTVSRLPSSFFDAKTSRLTDLKPLIPNLLVAIESAQPGAAKFIGAN